MCVDGVDARVYCLGFASGGRLWRYPCLLVVDLVVDVGSSLVSLLANLSPLWTLVRGCEVERLIGCEVELVGDFECGVSSFVVIVGIFRFSGTWCLFSVLVLV